MNDKLSSILIATVLTGFLALGSHPLLAEEYPIEQKLQQCKAAFKASHSGSATQEEAAKARKEHMTLMMEILQHMNTTNVAAADQGKALTPEALSNNVRVMGHLIEMLAADHMVPEYDTSYIY